MGKINLWEDFNLYESINRLSQAIKIKTISYPDYNQMDFDLFHEFLLFLENSYPNIKETCKKQIINGYSPVYLWESENKTEKPILLIGHYDVVPVDEDYQNTWEEGPFSGTIKDEYIWGRGSLDDKNQVIAVMESIEYLIGKRCKPNRDIYMAFGYDEEIGGIRGATEIAKYFEEKNIEFECVIDEGGSIVTDMIQGLTVPAALIGIAEKGSTNIRIKTTGKGGHSSMPPKSTAVGRLAKIISNVEEKPMKAQLTLPVKEMFKSMAPYMGSQKFILKNIDTFFPIVKNILSKSNSTNSMIRTTIAFTMTDGGEAPNVLPQNASAIGNLRILQGDSVESTIEHIKRVNPGIDFEIEELLVREPSSISDIESESYKILLNVIKEIYPEAKAMPYLLSGGTDSRKYYKLCKNIYRFSPVVLMQKDFDTIHSNNERISFENFFNMISFYIKFLENYITKE